MRLLRRRRPEPVDPVVDLLRHLGAVQPQPPPSPSGWARARSLLWRQRRRAVVPLVWLTGVWLVGQAVRSSWPGGGPWWLPVGVAALGWVAGLTVWNRGGVHVAHSTWTVAVTAVYLFGVSLGA